MKMYAMRIHRLGPVGGAADPLTLDSTDVPEPARGEVLVKVHACGVCHTELDEIEGRTAPPSLPMTPGHQVVGTVIREGPGCRLDLRGQRVGIALLVGLMGLAFYNDFVRLLG